MTQKLRSDFNDIFGGAKHGLETEFSALLVSLRGLSSHPVGGGVLPPLKQMYSPLREDHQLPPSGEEYLFCNRCSSILSRFCGRWCCG